MEQLICTACGEKITEYIYSAGYFDSNGVFSPWGDDKIYCSEYCAMKDSIVYEENDFEYNN